MRDTKIADDDVKVAGDDEKVTEATGAAESAALEILATISVCRNDELLLTEEESEEVLDQIVFALGDLTNDLYSFVCAVRIADKSTYAAMISELESRREAIAVDIQVGLDADDDVEVGTEEAEPILAIISLASKECTACHETTTQMDVNQCPMCGNPFMP